MFCLNCVCVVFFLQESLDVMSTNDNNTLGFTLELYSRYMDAAKVCEICIGKLGSYLTLQRIPTFLLCAGLGKGKGGDYFLLGWGGMRALSQPEKSSGSLRI